MIVIKKKGLSNDSTSFKIKVFLTYVLLKCIYCNWMSENLPSNKIYLYNIQKLFYFFNIKLNF